MKARWRVVAYGYPVMRTGPLQPRAGVFARTRLGAWWWARRYRRGYPVAVKYERVVVSRAE